VNRVVGAQPMLFREVSGLPDQRAVDADNDQLAL
jgi:hypothetical protein